MKVIRITSPVLILSNCCVEYTGVFLASKQEILLTHFIQESEVFCATPVALNRCRGLNMLVALILQM